MAKSASKRAGTDDVLRELRAFGMAYPGAHFKSPWPGHMDLAVNDKTFAYLSIEGEPLRISCKLPQSSGVALMLPFCTPTAYGLGKSGWVSAELSAVEPDVAMLKSWIDESYRAQAPKKMVAQIGAVAEGTAAKAAKAAAKAARKPARKSAKKAAPKPARRPAAKAATKTARKPAGKRR